MSSGWIVEPLSVEGQEMSLVWYITKVILSLKVALLSLYGRPMAQMFSAPLSESKIQA